MGKIYVSTVLREARSWIGYKEKASNAQLEDFEANAGANNWTIFAKVLADYGFYNGNKNGFAWCAPWVDYVLLAASGWDAAHTKEVLHYTGPYGASCTYSAGYYKAANAWHSEDPQPGDQIFFGSASDIQHTGLVERVTDGVVYTIEGNSGNAVQARSYALGASNIVGYGRPAYDGDAPPAETEPFRDVQKDAFYHDAVLRAKAHGVMVGTGPDTFAPDRAVTRGELAVVAERILELCGKA